MASQLDDAKRFVSNLRDVSGRQTYFLDVPGTDTAAALSVVSVHATERMGAPTEVRPRRYSRVTLGLSEADWQRIATDLSSPSV
ncbi:hypothetical protein [Burkholderia ubonensis]|uniref:hypothetical protein n=1 Tax=Burkholderia ubonensis TaxID=101571 RepID=UPI00075F4ED3|nr:hypothetical protein [Burkholderia ubonensis]KVV43433.1 hypothetical protein WK81_14355 [Burkholderia ubonensis]KVW37717.1 hypothetical protein WK95_21000 [Burkholderia ubonensis]